jgi:hypothetical protein
MRPQTLLDNCHKTLPARLFSPWLSAVGVKKGGSMSILSLHIHIRRVLARGCQVGWRFAVQHVSYRWQGQSCRRKRALVAAGPSQRGNLEIARPALRRLRGEKLSASAAAQLRQVTSTQFELFSVPSLKNWVRTGYRATHPAVIPDSG